MGEYDLYHAERKHKYIKKIGKRYFYTQQEIKAYLDAKKKDVTFEKGDSYDYDSADGSKMKDYHIDFNKQKGSYTDAKGKKHEYTMSDKIGVKVGNKKVQVYNTTNQKYWKDDERWSTKRHGRLKSSYAEDGSSHTLDLSDKKTFKKRDAADRAREKELEDWQVSQGYRKTDAQLKLEKKEKVKKRREKGKAAIIKQTKKSVNSLKKQATKGKKTVSKFYKNYISPDVTVTYSEATIKK